MNQTSPEFTAASETQENNDRESNGEKETEGEREFCVKTSDLPNRTCPQKGNNKKA